MSSLPNRIKQLETLQGIQPAGSWKDFITGKWEPSPQEWAKFLGEKENHANKTEAQGTNDESESTRDT